jgi:hypothetical protein
VRETTGHFSQEILGTFPKPVLCLGGVDIFFVIGGHIVWICIVSTTKRKGMIFKAGCRHKFQRKLKFSLLQKGIFVLSVQFTVGTKFEVLFSKGGHTIVWIWNRFQGRILWGLLGAISEFLLLENVFILLICTFLKLNKISLIMFPHIGVFPGWLPKFLGVYMDL